MAIQLPSNLYSGEAERFNSFPHVQFQTQLLAKRKAQEEALDEYYKKLPSTVNEKGVRDQERPVISKMIGQYQQNWMNNKDKIRNPKLDGGAARFNLEKQFRDIQDYVAGSQNLGKTGLEIGKKRFEAGNEYIFHNPDKLKEIAAHEAVLGTPEHKGIDLATWVLPPRPFDQGDYLKDLNGVKFDEGTPIIQPHPTDKYRNVEITPRILNKDSKNQIAQIAATRYENDWAFKNHIDNVLAKDKPNLERLNKLFQDNYGYPVQNEHDLATAFSLDILPKEPIKQKTFENELRAKEAQERGFAHQEKMQRIRQANAKDLIAFRDSLSGQDEVNEWVENYVNKVVDENKPQPTKNWLGQPKVSETTMIVPDQIMFKALGDPAKTEITKDGNYKLTYVKKQKDENGDDVEVIDAARSGTFTPEQIKLALGYKATTKKQLSHTMSGGKSQKGTQGKSSSTVIKSSKPVRVKQGDNYFILNDQGEYEPE